MGMGMRCETDSRGKLPRSGGMGLEVFCRPPGPPKLMAGFEEEGSWWWMVLLAGRESRPSMGD